jgi:mono/diheme cytochrome c family protein
MISARHNLKRTVLLLGSVVGLMLAGPRLSPSAGKDQSAPTAAEVLFAQRVWPLLKEKCLACHGEDVKKIRGGLDLRTRAGMLAGGDSGKPALVPGQPEKSPLYLAATRKDPDRAMPPKENDRLTPQQLALLKQWVADGASWPDLSRVGKTPPKGGWDAEGGVTVATSGGQSPEWTHRRYRPEDLWAYRPVRKAPVPQTTGAANPIDAFLLKRLKEKGTREFAPPVDRRILIRRATFDLTGLPPSPKEVETFLRDDSPDDFGRLVDRLLASPQYGEQMARHWFDVVRYADTSGFSNDFERPHAWRYRDYVVRSFNGDKPYDRFITEQLAGDEIDPKDPEMLIAVGFLRMGPWEHTGMTVAAVTRQQYLDDVTHHVGVSLLGQALRCARCHDHKFDPVPTRDYYRIQAVFAPVQFAERRVPFLPRENTSSFAEGKALAERRIRETSAFLARIRKKNEAAVAALMKERGVERVSDLTKDDLSRRDNIGLTLEDLSLRKIYQKRRQYFDRESQRYEPHALSVYSGPPNNYNSNRPLMAVPASRRGEVPAVRILAGGSLQSPGETVTPGVLSAVAGSNDTVAPSAWNTVPDRMEERRLSFARWVASPRNTLTARVIVNRVWQWHFGRGLVATPNNFGKMGAKPTHPELLDWLAAWFVENGWSLKKLHRLIMTSAAYQQSGRHPQMEELLRRDPKNNLLAYFPSRRLTAEEMRDTMLALTGELNLEMGGTDVFPEINWEVAFQPRHIMGSVAPAYQPSPRPKQRNRRTLYAFRIRTLADPTLEVFNRPGSETSCERRDETTIAPQAFALFNGEFAQDRALALAVRLEKESGDLEGQVRRAFALVYGRQPTAEEVRLCAEHVRRMVEHHRKHPLRAVRLPTSVRRHVVEEMTGQDFLWDEPLDVLKDYRRDLKPWDVGPRTRALADLCLVLLNSNEFLYVR